MVMEALDFLVFAPHPDDAELGMAGTIIKSIQAGKRIGIVDLTRGELGTKGSADIRSLEVQSSSAVLGLQYRANLDLGDGQLRDTHENRLLVAEEIRKTRCETVFVCPPYDPHPDHQAAAQLVSGAFFLARLPKVETASCAFSPRRLLHYFIHRMQLITFAVDISAEFGQKMEAIRSFKSQFINPELPENYRAIGTKSYLTQIEAYNRTIGAMIGVEFAEGYYSPSPLSLDLPTDLV